jgi:hypothetical protein
MWLGVEAQHLGNYVYMIDIVDSEPAGPMKTMKFMDTILKTRRAS